MNLASIKKSAEIVWRLLSGDNRKWNYNEIKKATGLQDRNLNAAIGWLAGKGFIQFDNYTDEEKLYVELNYYIG